MRKLVRASGELRPRSNARRRVKMAALHLARARRICAAGLAVVLPLGLATKLYPGSGPFFEWSRDFGGDALYQIALMLVAVLVRPTWRVGRVAWASFGYSCLVEVSQLARTPWLDQVRETIFGRLVLGSTFAWADFGYFAGGSFVGWLVLRRALGSDVDSA